MTSIIRPSCSELLSSVLAVLTDAALSRGGAAAGAPGLTDGAALPVGDAEALALPQVVTLDLVAEHLSVVAHTDPAWLRLPDVPVGVRLAVRRAALVVT